MFIFHKRKFLNLWPELQLVNNQNLPIVEFTHRQNFRAQICAVHRTPKSAQVCEPAAESQRKIIIKSVQIFKYKNSVKICKINLRRFSKVKFMLRCILTEKLYYLLPVVFIVQLYHSIILLIFF